jgi:hypothetical protein
VEIVYDASSVIKVNVEVAGIYDVKFGFSYPNHIELGGTPEYDQYDYDIKEGNPIKLSYFVTDNAIYDAEGRRKTYYNTLVVNAAGFTDVEWRIDGRTAPTNNSTESGGTTDNILTIRAQDWTLENTHTVVFVGTHKNNIKYSGTFEFKVVEQEDGQ